MPGGGRHPIADQFGFHRPALFPAGRSGTPDQGLRGVLQSPRYHLGLGNVTPADAYFGKTSAIIEQREKIKQKTIERRRLQHRKTAASHQPTR